ncbi:MAG: ATP phosphoribosyltransferase regulatory subunit [Rhodobacterales bacterium]|nr:ATP phosphoribosyltransferase regulatory subunit [Rhodobacterales bacterium]
MIRAAERDEGARLLDAFRDAGAIPVDCDLLLPAETLLDLYGEDLRRRAYVTQDPLRGEMMLRPDFTVPVVQRHMAGGAEPARYCYLGEVFRKQDHLDGRPNEYLQAGFELFAREAPAEADAEVFALFARLLAPLGLQPVTGDMGVLVDAVRGLTTTDRRKTALLRHIWRPRRFRQLLDRYSGRTPPPEARLRLIERLASGDLGALMAQAGPMIGLRDETEIAARAAALVEDAATPPVARAEVQMMEDLLQLAAPAPAALYRLRDMAVDLPALAPAADRFAERLAALAARGVDPEALPFEAALGRTTLEYYDGFVFAFAAPGRDDWPAVASGGRYDALTAVLGQGRHIPAVGGIIRPGLLAALRRGA